MVDLLEGLEENKRQSNGLRKSRVKTERDGIHDSSTSGFNRESSESGFSIIQREG